VITSDTIGAIGGALAKAQNAMKPAVKDANNPAFKSKYADLAAVWEACRGPLTANGIGVVQDVILLGDKIAVSTRLVHSSGEWIEFGPLPVPSMKQDAHGVGSATSYARRYGLSAAVGITADDDDGNAAAGKGNGQPELVREPVARALPHGYAEWLTDMRAAADEGTAQLEKAWKASRSEYRAHIQATEPATWNKLKAIAATKQQVTA
jgi:hypothetical protein